MTDKGQREQLPQQQGFEDGDILSSLESDDGFGDGDSLSSPESDDDSDELRAYEVNADEGPGIDHIVNGCHYVTS